MIEIGVKQDQHTQNDSNMTQGIQSDCFNHSIYVCVGDDFVFT